MTMVVDASMAAAWVLVDEQNPAAEPILDQVEATEGSVPCLFWHELRNIMLKVERRGRGTPTETAVALHRLRSLPLKMVQNRDDAAVLSLARLYRLTAYDAAYLDLAVAKVLPVATMDRRLADAARLQGLTVLGPLARPDA